MATLSEYPELFINSKSARNEAEIMLVPVGSLMALLIISSPPLDYAGALEPIKTPKVFAFKLP